MQAFARALAAGLVLLGMAPALAPPPAAAQAHTDYCQYGAESILFLIDRTTAYDDEDRRIIVESVSAVVDHLNRGDRIVVATIGGHYSESARVFNACVPGCPSNGFVPDLLSGCRAVIARRDLQDFRARLSATLRPLTRNNGATTNSDITGTIAQATQHPIGGRAYGDIYIFSDMLENSQALPWRMFRDTPNPQVMSVVRENGLVPSVRGAGVHIAGYGRLHDPGRPYLPADVDRKIRGFWTAYFNAGGAGQPEFVAAFTN